MWLRAKTARKITFWVLTTVWTLVVGISVDFVSDYLRQQGENPKGIVTVIHAFLAGYLQNPWIGWPLYSTLLLLTGFTLGQWLDEFLRNQEKSEVVPLPLEQDKPSINWEIWRQRTLYTIEEFAAILAMEDPISIKKSREQSAYEKLLIEEAELRLLMSNGATFKGSDGQNYLAPASLKNTVLKKIAVEWARKKNFPVSHIE